MSEELFSCSILLGLCVGHGDVFPCKCSIDSLSFLTLWAEIRFLLYFSVNVAVDGLVISVSCLTPKRVCVQAMANSEVSRIESSSGIAETARQTSVKRLTASRWFVCSGP